MSGRRRTLPSSARLLGMMVANAVISTVVLYAVYAMFGLNNVLMARLSQVETLDVASKWQTLWPLIPGSAIAFACLWFCLIVVGRTRGINWPSAFFYGIGIAFGNVLLGGLLNGLLHGNPLLGLLLGLLMLFLVPATSAGMVIFGAIMGLINARFAASWIDRHYPRAE